MVAEITKDFMANVIRADIEAALATVGEKHGLKMTAGNATFAPTNFSLKIDAVIIGANPDKDRFLQNATRLGLQASDFGREFADGKHKFTICGMSKTGLVIASRKAGGEYTFKPWAVSKALGYPVSS